MVPGLKLTSSAAAKHTAANIPRDVEAPVEIYSPQTGGPVEHTLATAANMPGAAAEHAEHRPNAYAKATIELAFAIVFDEQFVCRTWANACLF